MGLLYQFPISKDETDYVHINHEQGLVELKSYGLPLIFWGYVGAISLILLMMIIGIKDPLIKMIELGGPDQYLAIAIGTILLLTPFVLISFFFYEKRLSITNNKFLITHRLWGLPLFKKEISLNSLPQFEISHFMDSPNMAKKIQDESLRGFQNKGHFHLYIIDQNGSKVLADRSSNKSDLDKIAKLLFLKENL